MRLKMIWQLMRVNILYAGQAGALVRYRQRQAANPNKKLTHDSHPPVPTGRGNVCLSLLLYEWLLPTGWGTHAIYGDCFRLRAHDAGTGIYDLLQCLL